jgi:AraC family transcriptional regulator of adaptative response / DNA-3-methyladenine glycosylase II
MKRDDAYYEAMLARDSRFDGKFFVGVKTTGIYCRPICPAKPKRQNVEFFRSHLEAEKAGYRPCLRCRPESAPQSPAWIGKSAIVQRTVRALNQGALLEFNEDEFASRFGVSARHLRRLFVEEIGKTPKQLAFDNRLNLARKLICETKLTVTEVALASGFQSIRRFNDAFKERFKKSPSALRRGSFTQKGPLTLSLPYRPPFDFDGLLAHYESHGVGDLEWFTPGTMHRIVRSDQAIGQISISNQPSDSKLLVGIDFPDTSQIHVIIARVRSLFDLDSDPVLVANALENDKRVATLLKKWPGIRLPSGWDPFEIAIATILGQFVSVSRGRELVRELIEQLGEDSGLKIDGRAIKLFPSPEKIASSNLQALKTTGARKTTLRDFSRAVAEGNISLEPTQDVAAFVERVRRIKGIGAWTASYMALKVLRHTDAFPQSDLIIARALETLDKAAIAEMSPWRGYVAALLWRDHSHGLNSKRKENG